MSETGNQPEISANYTRRWVNPYRKRVGEFEGTLFSAPGVSFPSSDFPTLREHFLQIAGTRSIVAELGSGSGGHLIGQAKQNPEICFIGFEKRYKRAVRTAEKIEQENLENALIVRTDVKDAFDIFPKNSLTGVFCNFPDPWQRQRSAKHRMLSEFSLEAVSNMLKNEGFFSVKTDHPIVAQDFLRAVQTRPEFSLERESQDFHNSEFLDESNVWSEFERLFASKKTPVFYFYARKVA